MIDFLESSAGRMVDRVHSIGTSFDPEVLSLPGGTIIALILWAYGGIALSLRGAAQRTALRAAAPLSLPAAAVCTGCCGHK